LPTITPAAGQGFWGGIGIFGSPLLAVTAEAVGVTTAGGLAAWLFYLPAPITIKNITASINVAAGAAAVCDAGLYPATAGSTITVGTKGGINGNSATTQSVGLYTWNGSAYVSAASVTVSTGWYYLVWTQSVADTTMRVWGWADTADAVAYTIMNNVSGALSVAADQTAATAGTLPSTLPTLTALSTQASVPAVWISG
jgi:hypothetical protein